MLLNRPHKAVYYGTKCNYQCSYCLAGPDRERLGGAHFDMEGAVRLLKTAKPSVISVSGGEPGMWPLLPRLIESLEQHVFIIATNLSLLPEAYFHPRVKLLLATYHPDMVTEDAFFENARQVVDKGQRVHSKIIVQPGAERRNFSLWERLNNYGAPATFVPLEIYGRNVTAEFDPAFLRDVTGDYLTSTILNGRFFRTFPDYIIPTCTAGTEESYMIGPSGDIRRCAIVQCAPAVSMDEKGTLRPSSVSHPSFLADPQPCPTNSGNCMCEFHHWNEMAPGNDNSLWENYLKTGTWLRPTIEDLKTFLNDMRWGTERLDKAFRS